ncbi:hypothetical protein V6N12_000450 [Hibiscus sabdariffa]|uniref:Uncharacterized protein n=1 Tax=Hibiscus sabdariffa TaxID=183260 RepID=A0ABR1ZJD0_9ROSI
MWVMRPLKPSLPSIFVRQILESLSLALNQTIHPSTLIAALLPSSDVVPVRTTVSHHRHITTVLHFRVGGLNRVCSSSFVTVIGTTSDRSHLGENHSADWSGEGLLSREEEDLSLKISPVDTDTKEMQDVLTDEFEFRLEDLVAMLPANKLFSDDKLVPLHFSTVKQQEDQHQHQHPPLNGIRSCETSNSCCGIEIDVFGSNHYLFSPKASRCLSQ